MKIGEFGYGMADGIVISTLCDFTAIEMGHGNAEYQCGGSCCKHLITVAENYNQVGRQLCVCIGKTY